MKVVADASIFVGDQKAFGRVEGPIELSAVPSSGDTISLLFPTTGAVMKPPNGFKGQLKVGSVIFSPGPSSGSGVILMLEDIVAESEQEAFSIARYLEEGFGLFFDQYQ